MAYRATRTCKYCMKPNLTWGKFPNRFGNFTTWLREQDGSRHSCDEYRRAMGKAITGNAEPTPTVPRYEPTPVEPTVVEPVVEPTVVNPVNVEPIAGYTQYPNSHESFPELVHFISKAGVNVMLVGPAGSGKTYAAEQLAEILGLDYYPFSVGPQTSKTDIMGFMGTKLVRSGIRDAFEYGGVLLLDEFDTGNAGVLTILNAILWNNKVLFPSENGNVLVTRHPNFIVVVGANTFGKGGNSSYNGRQKLDDATLDRFVGIIWDYDRALEARIAGITCPRVSFQKPIAPLTRPELDWTTLVWQLRDIAEELGSKAIFGTRKIVNGLKLLKSGVSRQRVEECVLWFGMPADERAKFVARINQGA